MRIILASASPRRAELLRAAGFEFEIRAADIDESVRPLESPADYVLRLSATKAGTVSTRSAGAEDVLVIGADTAVVVNGEILGKPQSHNEATEMLRRLSGRCHQVITGVTVKAGARELGHIETTLVELAPLSDDDIEWYVRSGEGRDKAGGYAIQGLAARFIPRIDGSYSNVVGLPIAPVWRLIQAIDPCNRSGIRLS